MHRTGFCLLSRQCRAAPRGGTLLQMLTVCGLRNAPCTHTHLPTTRAGQRAGGCGGWHRHEARRGRARPSPTLGPCGTNNYNTSITCYEQPRTLRALSALLRTHNSRGPVASVHHTLWLRMGCVRQRRGSSRCARAFASALLFLFCARSFLSNTHRLAFSQLASLPPCRWKWGA